MHSCRKASRAQLATSSEPTTACPLRTCTPQALAAPSSPQHPSPAPGPGGVWHSPTCSGLRRLPLLFAARLLWPGSWQGAVGHGDPLSRWSRLTPWLLSFRAAEGWGQALLGSVNQQRCCCKVSLPDLLSQGGASGHKHFFPVRESPQRRP